MQIIELNWVGPLILEYQEIRRVPDRVTGVYLLHWCARLSGSYPIFYVGASFNLRRRLLQHLGRRTKPAIQAIRAIEATWFSAAPVPPGLLSQIEAGLIRFLRPISNASLPAVEPIIPNLPPLRFGWCLRREAI